MRTFNLVLGRYDDPENQIQKDYEIDLFQNHLIIFGGSMTGKTTIIKTIITRIHQVASFEEEIYILDFNNSFEKYFKLPYVVANFDAYNEENVRRVFKVLEEKLSKNIKILQGKMFNMTTQDIPHATLIIDGVNTFFESKRYEKYQEILLKLVRDGISKGISIILTANEDGGQLTKYIKLIGKYIVLDMPKDSYYNIFLKKVDKPISVRGRGIVNINNQTYELQSYLPYKVGKEMNDSVEEAFIDDLNEKLKNQFHIDFDYYNDKKMISFTDDLNEQTWKKYTIKKDRNLFREKNYLVAGLEYYEMSPIKVNLREARSIGIYGKKKFGKSNLLALILEGLKYKNDEPYKVIFLEDGRNGLKDIQETITSLGEDNYEIYTDINKFIEYMYDHFSLEETNNKNDKFIHDIKTVEDLNLTFPDPKIMSTLNYPEISKKQLRVNVEADKEKEIDNLFKVIVIQSRYIYQTEANKKIRQFMLDLCSYISGLEKSRKVLFIFSDIPKLTLTGVEKIIFNDSIKYAFLLDDIVRFIKDRGKGSVFGNQDESELKEEFGTCELGDGFFFDREADKIQKLKFIKEI